jgi:hypothetical protein
MKIRLAKYLLVLALIAAVLAGAYALAAAITGITHGHGQGGGGTGTAPGLTNISGQHKKDDGK